MKETLQIAIRNNRRSEDSIQITRKVKDVKRSYSYGQSELPQPETELFTDVEQFEISWFDQMVKFFHEHQNTNATDLERYRLFLPENFYQALFDLHIKCQQHNIDYKPVDSILKSIVNKIKVTEKKLYEKTGIISNVLAEINFQEIADSPDNTNNSTLLLFKTLIEVPDFYNQFSQISIKEYNKKSTVKIGHFKGYAQGHALPSKWICACAIDVIAKHASPFNMFNADQLMDLWIKPKIRAGFEFPDFLRQLNDAKATPEFIKSVEKLYHCSL